MKIDIEIQITAIVDNDMLKVGDTVTIPIDKDYVEDFDDVIQQAEEYLYEKYSMSLWYRQNFTIVNETDSYDDIF